MKNRWIPWLAAMMAAIVIGYNPEARQSTGLLSRVDHLVYATPNVNVGVDTIEKLLGIRATPGGQHPGRGTRNALIALGPSVYLEIIGPDPEQPTPQSPRAHGIDDLRTARLAAWAAKGTDLEQLFNRALLNGIKLGDVTSGSRRTPDAVLLAWRFTNSSTIVADGLVPFFIDWGDTPHPSRTAAPGASLIDLRAEHPDADRVQKMLRDLGLDLSVKKGPSPALIATINSPRGRVQLR